MIFSICGRHAASDNVGNELIESGMVENVGIGFGISMISLSVP